MRRNPAASQKFRNSKIPHPFDECGYHQPGCKEDIALGQPAAAISGKSLQRGWRRGLRKALAKDHLTVDASVHLVVDILDACSRQIS